MATIGSGVHRYATIGERLTTGMLNSSRTNWAGRVALHPWHEAVSSGDDWWQLMTMLGVRSRTWLWAGWRQDLDADARQIVEHAVGVGAENVQLQLPADSSFHLEMWRAQASVLKQVVDQADPPEVTCPANGSGWILWCDPEQDHVDLFLEQGADCTPSL